jgi:hypothetical protein
MEGIRLTAMQTQKYYAPIAISKLYEHRENFLHIMNNAGKRRRYAISEKSGIKKYDIYNNEPEKKNKEVEKYKYTANIQKEFVPKNTICPIK